MQIPTTVEGLSQALAALGYADALSGIDPTEPEAEVLMLSQITWEFENSDQTEQDVRAHQKATALVQRFPWHLVDEQEAVDALEVEAAVVDAGEVIRFPTERARQAAGPPGPPGRVMQIQRIEVGPAPAPAPAPEPEQQPAPKKQYERTYGERYDRSMDVKDIAKIVRDDLNAAAKQGKIPKFKYSVKISRYSGGQSIDVVIKSSPQASVAQFMNLGAALAEQLHGGGFLPHKDKTHGVYKPEMHDLEQFIEKKLGDFNHDGSDTMTDYFDVKFYGHVRIDHDSEKAVKDELVAAYMKEMGTDKPLFDYKTYAANPAGAIDEYAKILKKAGYKVA